MDMKIIPPMPPPIGDHDLYPRDGEADERPWSFVLSWQRAYLAAFEAWCIAHPRKAKKFGPVVLEAARLFLRRSPRILPGDTMPEKIELVLLQHHAAAQAKRAVPMKA
jgi:hypothetical protein